MKIQMTKTVHGSLDGVTVQELAEGAEYETVDSPRGERLARHHIKQGVAVPVLAQVITVTTSDVPRPAPRKRK